jgi:hypothetical protein
MEEPCGNSSSRESIFTAGAARSCGPWRESRPGRPRCHEPSGQAGKELASTPTLLGDFLWADSAPLEAELLSSSKYPQSSDLRK